ncbi:MAG: immunoglobulin domain-containing protein, partial [Limisphaerales bacterium]
MLGVSQAATVGFNFQTHYCGADSYSGAVVTAPAFGIGTNSWESLPQMDTGYGCPADYYTLSNVIDTASSGSGLNPLPNGSLAITWSGYTANVSGFAGYSRSGPHYTFGGNGYKPGNEQVYWGFIRDGVNFGPGSSGGDNNQPGYEIDITGLRSLFTNNPFAVQLIGSADSMQYLTNAFIIDATANSTQSVMYPSTPPVNDSGDTSWVRGVGGGLSTASGGIDTDHLKIIGNRAAHVGPKTGYNFASTIAGFIITDKPVISMPPNSVLACGGDSFALSGYAVGVPPLSYQWRKDGAAIADATNSSYSVSKVQVANDGNYDLVVTNLYGAATSAVAVVTIDHIQTTAGNNFLVDSNPNGPAHDGLTLGATWLASSGNRTGVMSFNAAHPDQIIVPSATNFDAPAGTIMFWMRAAAVTGTNSAILFDRRNPAGCVLALGTDGSIQFQSSVGNPNQFNSATTGLGDNNWHLISLVYDQTLNGEVDIYVDGKL